MVRMEDVEYGGDGEVTTETSYKGWQAMPYVIGNEACEKLGTIGGTANMVVYFTTVFHIDAAGAAAAINLFHGTANLAPLAGAFLSDTFLGRYATLAFATLSSFLGMSILTLTAAVPSLHPPPSSPSSGPTPPQLAVLVTAFAFLVIGAGGIRPCNLAFGADQFDPRTDAGRAGIASFFNWYYFTFTVAMMVSSTVVVYLQSSVSWSAGLAVPAGMMLLACVLFFAGTKLYVRVRPDGSPFTSFAHVLAAAFRNRRLPAAPPAELFDPPHRSSLVSKLHYTEQFRWLDKAAIVRPPAAGERRRPCSVQQVEEVKCLARILPVWCCCCVAVIAFAHQSTFVVLQALQSDRRLAGSRFQIPAASLVFFQMLALTAWIPLYDRVLVPQLKKLTGRDGGVTLLQRIGFGIFLGVAAMATAAAVERRRRSSPPEATMPCLWLVPQLVLVGVAEAFAVIGQVELYYRQFPENMRSVAGALLFLGFAVSSYASSLMVTVTDRVTRRGGRRRSWLDKDLNEGRLDLFYLLVAAIVVVDLFAFIACAKWFQYKKPAGAAVADAATSPAEVVLRERKLEK